MKKDRPSCGLASTNSPMIRRLGRWILSTCTATNTSCRLCWPQSDVRCESTCQQEQRGSCGTARRYMREASKWRLSVRLISCQCLSGSERSVALCCKLQRWVASRVIVTLLSYKHTLSALVPGNDHSTDREHTYVCPRNNVCRSSRPQQNIPVWPVSRFVPAKVLDMLRPGQCTSHANRTQL